MKSTNSPILFLVFNRPKTTKRVFEVIRQAKPQKLYIASDGPRPDKLGENLVVHEVRNLVKNVDWDCNVSFLFREKNLGCKVAVSSAIEWFFEHEMEGIILEDDCLPDLSFFEFCDDLLPRYRNDTRITMISGDNFQDGHSRTKYSYYFSKYTHIWGWATWRRAWKHWDGNLTIWPEIRDAGLLNDIGAGNIDFQSYWEAIFEKYFAGGIDTWDYPLLFSSWTQNGLCILPNTNLVTNIGFGEGATHTTEDSTDSEIPAIKIDFPLQHPAYVIPNKIADDYTEKYHYQIKGKTVPDPKYLKSLFRTFYSLIRGGAK